MRDSFIELLEEIDDHFRDLLTLVDQILNTRAADLARDNAHGYAPV
jgi:hypothetical protein